MSLSFTARGKIKKVEVKEKKTTVQLQTSRKKTDYQKNFEKQKKEKVGVEGKVWDYANSDWFMDFVGEAHEAMSVGDFRETDVVTVQGMISREPYFKEEEKKDVYPKNNQMTVFKVEIYRKGEGKKSSQVDQTELADEDSIPF